MHVSACPICNEPCRLVLPVQNVWDHTIWKSVRCVGCGHRYTDPMPSDEQLTRVYSDSYFNDGGKWVCGFWEGSYVSNEDNLRAEAQRTLPLIKKTSGKLLEVGAAGGFFLDEARKVGFSVMGIELNETMAKWGREKLGLEIYPGAFETMYVPAASVDVVVAQDVLEHIRDPLAFIKKAAYLLRPEGILFIRGPMEEGYRDRIYLNLRKYFRRNVLVNHEPPFHLQGFVRSSLQIAAEKADLHVDQLIAYSEKNRSNFSSLKETIASAIDYGADKLDKLTGAGDFVTLSAVKI